MWQKENRKFVRFYVRSVRCSSGKSEAKIRPQTLKDHPDHGNYKPASLEKDETHKKVKSEDAFKLKNLNISLSTNTLTGNEMLLNMTDFPLSATPHSLITDEKQTASSKKVKAHLRMCDCVQCVAPFILTQEGELEMSLTVNVSYYFYCTKKQRYQALTKCQAAKKQILTSPIMSLYTHVLVVSNIDASNSITYGSKCSNKRYSNCIFTLRKTMSRGRLGCFGSNSHSLTAWYS